MRQHQTDVVLVDQVEVRSLDEDALWKEGQAKDGSWYVAALNNKESRKIGINTSFLGEGEWKVESFSDTSDGDVNPMKYIHKRGEKVRASEKLTAEMALGDGLVMKFTK